MRKYQIRVLSLTDTTITTCPPNYFLCPDHRCIYNSYVCDGDQDCLDGSDEKDCGRNLWNLAHHCVVFHSYHMQCSGILCTLEFVCASYQFACASGDQCVSSSYRCDGVFDCRDHSDEQGCRKFTIDHTSPIKKKHLEGLDLILEAHFSAHLHP